MTWHIGHPQVFWGLAALPAVWWSLRGLQRALPPARFAGVALTRHLLVAAMLVGIADIGMVQEQPRDPLVVYLVDRSESIDARERITEIAKQISPVYHVSADDPPTLIIHGDADLLVPIQQAQLIMAKLDEVKVPHELVTRPGVAHGWKDWVTETNVFADWFDKHLTKP